MGDARIPRTMLQTILLNVIIVLIGQLLGPIRSLLGVLSQGLAVVIAVGLVLAFNIAVAEPDVVIHV
jgi:hypothetical protein